MGLFFNENKSQIKKLKKIADQVVALEDKYKAMSDEELKESTAKLKERLKNGETLDDILPDAYATIREASDRVLNMRHFYVQILGGIALHQGRIAEMATGEGKTLVATLPAYLNALTEKGVHVVTVNEYLAKRDAEWMGKVFKFLGLSVGVSISKMNEKAKRDAYNCDITYCKNNELVFDYLRDNMTDSKDRRLQRGRPFAILDEVDSILIDEARTPLIISGQGVKSSERYLAADKFAKSLRATKDEDIEIDIKTKAINLSETGITKAEQFFKIENLADVNHVELNHYINNALKANYIMIQDQNYIVENGEVIIVDEFTGRLMPGRRFNDGLHQAIEAKEGVKVKDENRTLATITFQNYFRTYGKLSGMTGTAKTEEEEFRTIYNLDVVKIPSNLPNIRIDEPDIVFTTMKGKINAIVEEIKKISETGRPILIGTTTIEKSEELSRALKAAHIKHNVLNAKNHEMESEIVAQAGRINAVTIATNMAGRGTDILLGGNPEFMAKRKMKDEGFTDEQISYATAFNTIDNEELNKARARYKELYKLYKITTDAEKDEVRKLGGLHIIGTERHESRRIDNQLRGRASRQGDPGSTVFFLSLEDDLLKRFGGEKLQRVATFFKFDENSPIQLKILSRQIEGAQKKIEAQNFGTRKYVLQLDNVLNAQRELIYKQRNKVLDGYEVHKQVLSYFPEYINSIVEKVVSDDKPYYEWDLEKINTELEKSLIEKGTNLITEKFVEECDVADLEEKVLDYVIKKYEKKIEEAEKLGVDFEEIEKLVLLKVVDSHWKNHIDDMQLMKNEIYLRSFSGQDPILSYKQDAYEMYNQMIDKIRQTVSMIVLKTRLEVKEQANPYEYKNIQATTYDPTQSPTKKGEEIKKPEAKKKVIQQTIVNDSKVGRNEPCPCGSGKKFKKCCGVEK